MNFKIKKTAVSILAIISIISVGTVTTIASEPVKNEKIMNVKEISKTKQNNNFIDTNGDNICDHYVIGQGKGSESKQSNNYIDADGNGACDNYTTNQNCDNQSRYGYMSRHGHGCHSECNKTNKGNHYAK